MGTNEISSLFGKSFAFFSIRIGIVVENMHLKMAKVLDQMERLMLSFIPALKLGGKLIGHDLRWQCIQVWAATTVEEKCLKIRELESFKITM
jgi:hypothetical protein